MKGKGEKVFQAGRGNILSKFRGGREVGRIEVQYGWSLEWRRKMARGLGWSYKQRPFLQGPVGPFSAVGNAAIKEYGKGE